MYRRMKRNLCDADTGERIDEPVYERETDDRKKIEGEFMKLSVRGAKKMLEVLTATEIAMVIGLVPYVSYTDCCLRRGGVGEVMSVKDIAGEMGMEEGKVYRLVKALEGKGVMGHHATGSILRGYEGKVRKVYTVNPFIYCRGQKVNRAVYEFYAESGW